MNNSVLLQDGLDTPRRNSLQLLGNTLPYRLLVRLGFGAIDPSRNTLPVDIVSRLSEGENFPAQDYSLVDCARIEKTAMAFFSCYCTMKKRAAARLGSAADPLVRLVKLLLEGWRRISAERCLADARIDEVQNDTGSGNGDLLNKMLRCHDLHSFADWVSKIDGSAVVRLRGPSYRLTREGLA